MSICIVDDSEVVRSIVKKALTLYDFTEIIEAVDGLDGLDKIKKNYVDIDLYVLDVNMPGMDGISLISEIRVLDTTTPIIMLTTETDKSKMIQAKTKGATGWIIKPFDADKFIKVIKMLLIKD